MHPWPIISADCTRINIYGNYDLSGNFLTNLNQVASPNGTTRTTVTCTGTNTVTYNASYADEYIGVQSVGSVSGEVDVVLPLATEHAGKMFIIADEGEYTPNIKILPSSTDTINGVTGATGGVSIADSYGGLTVVSDGTNWFAY